jgi:molybdopterin-guanine dinucleotide biosynthesis protein A
MLFSAVILAGGKSRRMGQDKAWLEVEGQPLIRRQIELARSVGAAEVFISGRADCDYSALDCPVLRDAFPNAGPLAGIERALHVATSPLLLVLAVDLPRLTTPVLRDLLSHCTPHAGAIPRIKEQIEPLVAFYPRAAHKIAVARLSEAKNAVRDFAQDCVNEQLAVFTDLPAETHGGFRNWNSPTELAE